MNEIKYYDTDMELMENFFIQITLEDDKQKVYVEKHENMSRDDFEEYYGKITDRLVHLKLMPMESKPIEIGLEETFWIVDIVSLNKDGKRRTTTCECRNQTDLSAMIFNYKPPRGYVVVKYDIVRGEVLV